MSSPATERRAATAKKPPEENKELLVVRRRDVERLPYLDLPGLSSLQRGYPRDPRYPSPRRFRQWLAFLIDLVVHSGVAFMAGMAAFVADVPGVVLLVVLVLGFVVASLADRVFLQRVCGATFGKLLTGLCVIRCDNGERPTLPLLIRQWLIGVFLMILAPLG